MAGEGKDNKKKSFMDKVREIDAADKKAELEEEARRAGEAAKREERARKAYEDKLRQERLELIKLKQGVISEEDIEKPVEEARVYTLKDKIGNFFYHNKTYLIVGAAVAALAVFLTVDFINKERPDLKSMYIAPDYEMSMKASDLTPLWSDCCPDYNGDGEPLARLYYIPALYAEDDMASIYFAQGDRTKLVGEFQSGDTVMIIGTKEAYQALGILEDGVFADCREIFPDDPYAEELGYRLAGTDLMDMLGADIDDSQLYVSFRSPTDTMSMKKAKMQVYYDQAVEFWRNFVKEHRVDGLELEPTTDPEPLPVDEYYGY